MSQAISNLASWWRGASQVIAPRRTTVVATQFDSLVRKIRIASHHLRDLSDQDLRQRADQLRSSIEVTSVLDSDNFLESAFALVAESLRRVLGFEYYDVQFMAGIALTRGSIAQMQTGEGKSIVAALPAFVHGLSGQGVHVATTNPYLASRDATQVGPVLELLGLSVGLLPESNNAGLVRHAYRCDVTYGTGYQFGFDYLRDQLTLRRHSLPTLGRAVRGALRGGLPRPKLLQRSLAFAVIDEIDSVLIDEASTPLILCEMAAHTEPRESYLAAANTIADFQPEVHFTLDAKWGQVQLTKVGELKAFEALREHNCQRLDRPWLQCIRNALRAERALARDVDYVVRDAEVQIVDKFTGRICAERKWSDGLHQAIEVKESIELTPPNNSSARITRQKYFRRYRRICGMTGTATGSEQEFRDIYQLAVLPIPQHRPSQRRILPAKYFSGNAEKLRELVRDVRLRNADGQPVLIGTRTIRDSHEIAAQLVQTNLQFVLLNGVQNEKEAAIVAQAGQAGSVTIATNMAGRGTDIQLSEDAKRAGGLHVIATDHHESERVDRQLMGRCARQGDPGSYQMLASADDELFAKFAPALADAIRQSADEHGIISREFSAEIQRLQKRSLRESYEQRLRLLDHDRWTETLLDSFLGET